MQQREFAFSTIIATVMLLSVGCSANLNSKAPWVWERDPNSDDWSEELDLATLESKPALSTEPSTDTPPTEETPWRSWRPTEELGDVEPLILRWPVQTTGITSHYGPRQDPISRRPSYHYGLDMAGNIGDTVRASLRGIVIRASNQGGHGKRVVLKHPWGYTTSYSHLSKIFVRPGDPIAKGQPIGEIGATGRATGPHLHFELHHNGHHLDPLNFLGESLPLMRKHVSMLTPY